LSPNSCQIRTKRLGYYGLFTQRDRFGVAPTTRQKKLGLILTEVSCLTDNTTKHEKHCSCKYRPLALHT
jgi:hypothetical protein